MGKQLLTVPNIHSKMSISGDVTGKGKIQRFCSSRKATERGFPKDWKLNKNMHAVAADNRDSGCESGLAGLERQYSAYSVWAREIIIIWLAPRAEAEMPQMRLDTGSAVSIILRQGCGISFKGAKMMETGQLKMHI